jgi:hypothetical protein
MKSLWQTAWRGQDIVVLRDESEIDRVAAAAINRVMLLHRGSGDAPGDVLRSVVELADAFLIFGVETGFAGRVTFERQAFWAERNCVYWIEAAKAPLPLALRTGRWFLPGGVPGLQRVDKSQLAPVIERWPLGQPQTWEQRKRQRIARLRPFSGEPATESRG